MIFSSKSKTETGSDSIAIRKAIDTVQAVIQFDLEGNITDANENFLSATGYAKADIVGNHHRIFVDRKYAASSEYVDFWKKLFAIDITDKKLKNADSAGQLTAISRSQAVIEFNLDCEILSANENFCQAMGYKESEIVGQKHEIFVEPAYARSSEYKDFWASLRSGEFQSSEYMRIKKDGDPIWIQASYNPIFDANGKMYKVVKFATDITERKMIVEELAENLDKLASGDLTPRMSPTKNSDFSKLGDAFNATMERLTTLVADIQSASGAVSTGTKEIAQGARDLSGRTEEQAASLEETNAAIEDISNNITVTAKNAKKAHEAAGTAEQKAVRGDQCD